MSSGVGGMLRSPSGGEPVRTRSGSLDADARATWGALLARDAVDWALVAAFFLFSVITDGVHPFEQYLHAEQLWAYSYPLKRNTVPSWSVLPTAFVIPSLVFAGLHATKRLERRETARLLLGLFFACTLTLFVTNVVKLLVGRPRPHFATRCWPDGQVAGVPGVPVCSGTAAAVAEARKSFPSGHTSLATAGLAYLCFFLLAAVRPRAAADGGAAWRTAAALSPLLLALWIGLSRVRDYWHHWSDVATGAALGAVIAHVSFHKVAAARALPSTAAQPPSGAEAAAGGEEPSAAGEP